MAETVAYIPGERSTASGPLSRYLPPIPNGVGDAWLRARLPQGAWVLDPFGASPRLALEAARAGYRVLAAVNNPIARFLFDLYANPPGEAELRLTLAELSAAQKAGERLEPHLRALYLTRCHACGAEVEAQAFVWERGEETPAARIYTCPACKDSGERPATQQDAERARRFAGGALHRARALERVAPLDDPDRAFVEEALGMYLPRAVYALFTLVNKLESFPPERRRGLDALLLAAFDACSTLWAYPSTRSRPRQLVTPPRYLERNVWLALEEAAAAWPAVLVAGKNDGRAVALSAWPAQPPASGGVCLFDGRLRELADRMVHAQAGAPETAIHSRPEGKTRPDDRPERAGNALESEEAAGATAKHGAAAAGPIEIQAMLSALPRPNQAYWTLSALWAGWLWGHEATQAFKSVLRRRRYDWDWHAAALHANLQHIPGIAASGLPALALVGEAEPGFLNAAVAAGKRAGLRLCGLALRGDELQAQICWEIEGQGRAAEDTASETPFVALVRQAALDSLRSRGEPTPYLNLHAGILERIAGSAEWLPPEESLETALARLNTTLETALGANNGFIRYGSSARSLDAGLWWAAKLAGAPGARPDTAPAAPLADRVEMEVVRYLVKHPGAAFGEVDAAVCAAFPDTATPERELVQQVTGSYCEASDAGRLAMRPEDAPAQRSADLQAMQALLQAAGGHLGFTVKRYAPQGEREAVRWIDPDTGDGYDFYVIASAVFGELLLRERSKEKTRPVVVLPGGRASLVEYKLRRDPRLQQALQARWRLVKYRHMRRLVEDPSVTRENLGEKLGLDPLENSDPQMSLL